MSTVVTRWEIPEDEGRELFAALLAAALEEARSRLGPVRLVVEAIWAGWEETEVALQADGWHTRVNRGRVLRVLPASNLVATIASDAADAAWIAERIRAAWTDEESPIRFTARVFSVDVLEPAEPLFECQVEGYTTFAVWTAAEDEITRLRAIVADVTGRRGVDVELEEAAD